MPRAGQSIKQSEHGAYCWLNNVTGKVYVGGAYRATFEVRRKQHLTLLHRDAHFNCHLQASWNLYGEDAFDFIVLSRCLLADVEGQEQYWIDELKATDQEYGYNQRPIANSNLGVKFSERAKANFSNGAKRRLQRPGERERLAEISKIPGSTPEGRERLGRARRGVARTEEVKRRISESMKGKTNAKGSVPVNKGKRMSDEQRANRPKLVPPLMGRID